MQYYSDIPFIEGAFHFRLYGPHSAIGTAPATISRKHCCWFAKILGAVNHEALHISLKYNFYGEPTNFTQLDM